MDTEEIYKIIARPIEKILKEKYYDIDSKEDAANLIKIIIAINSPSFIGLEEYLVNILNKTEFGTDAINEFINEYSSLELASDICIFYIFL